MFPRWWGCLINGNALQKISVIFGYSVTNMVKYKPPLPALYITVHGMVDINNSFADICADQDYSLTNRFHTYFQSRIFRWSKSSLHQHIKDEGGNSHTSLSPLSSQNLTAAKQQFKSPLLKSRIVNATLKNLQDELEGYGLSLQMGMEMSIPQYISKFPYTLCQWLYIRFWLSISGNSSEKLHCGYVVDMPYWALLSVYSCSHRLKQ